MKRIAPVLLCLLLCLLCMTGYALAEDGCRHENAINYGVSISEGVWRHDMICPDCGILIYHHIAEADYSGIDADSHTVHCSECGISWIEGHKTYCGVPGETADCALCCAESVNIASHIYHPDYSEISVYIDAYSHNIVCGICGDGFGESCHTIDCSRTGPCLYCGAADMIDPNINHQDLLNRVDEERCYYSCSCGKETWDMQHTSGCNAEDPNTCLGCRKNTEEDGILIGYIQHSNERRFDENSCWTACAECGEVSDFSEHYFNCNSRDKSRCIRCDHTADEGIKLTQRHYEIVFVDSEVDGFRMHHQECWYCGYSGEDHSRDLPLFYRPNGSDVGSHWVSCPECEFEWLDCHMTNCDNTDTVGTCVLCGDENVHLGAHTNHPENSECAEYVNEFYHHSYCGICGDDWGDGNHVTDCSDPYHCKYCGTDNMADPRMEHNCQLNGFDKMHCYYSCACGESSDELWHVVYCDSEDQTTCVACGKNVDADGIVISVTWHHDVTSFNNEECWNTCSFCGELTYSGKHFTGCTSEDSSRCDNCHRSEEDGIIVTWRHTNLSHEDWEENGIPMHRQVCRDCSYCGSDHEMNLDLWFYCIDGELNEHWVYCSGCEYDWPEPHFADCGNADTFGTCLVCGAQDVNLSAHTNHPEDSTRFECVDENRHRRYCGICGDDWGTDGHWGICGSEDNTCIYCEAENVHIGAHIDHADYSEIGEFIDQYSHFAHCGICGDDWDVRPHVFSCADLYHCIFCGADNVSGRLEHPQSPIYSDEYGCKTSCACGQEQSEGRHGVSCTRLDADTLTCERCGETITNDRYDVWHDYQHSHTYWNDMTNEELHVRVCRDCDEEDQHPFRQCYIPWSSAEHLILCDECNQGWSESHWGACDGNDDDGICVYCGDEHVQIGLHVDHLELIYTQTDGNPDEHLVTCTACGHEWTGIHVIDCADTSVCRDCGAHDVTGDVDHVRIVKESTAEYCQVTCACGEIQDEGRHGYDCRKANAGADPICDRCGQEVSELDVWHEFEHGYTRWNDEWNCEEHILSCRNCGYEDENVHTCSRAVTPFNQQYHYVRCEECGVSWLEGHVAECGSEDNTTCAQCDTEVSYPLQGHINHPNNSESYKYEDEDSHRAYCSICGDDFGLQLHFRDCSGDERCAVCGAEGVYYAFSDHVMRLVNFDTDFCYWGCACGDYHYEVWHGIYCDSKDKNTCVECGKNVEDDGIRISDIWHEQIRGYDKNNCWTSCRACGYIEYFDEHYTACDNDDNTHCDNCGRSEEDGIKLVWKHTDLGHYTWDEDGIYMHRQFCGDCGYEGEAHAADLELTYTAIDGNPNNHWVSCPACEFDWREIHIAECGSANVCMDCGAENVNISGHNNHPDNSERYVYMDADSHKIYCGNCGDDWGWGEHVADCSDFDSDSMTGTCFYCGAENVNVIDVKHDTQLVDFDEELCYYRCACDGESYSWQHVVYCYSEDPNTCLGCGKNTETDDIVIGLIWHEEERDYNENECWTVCLDCGQELYRGPHYISCANEEQMCCDFCDTPREELYTWEFRHTNIDFNDSGDGWHDPWCLNCGERLSEPHEFSLYFKNGGYDTCRAYCETCGYLGDWEHQGQCGEPDEHTWCIRCGAEDVKVYDHGNHIGSDAFDMVDEDWHLAFCSVCGDEHYAENHKSARGCDDNFGTCAVCGAEEVNLYGPVTEEEYIEDGIRVFITYHEDGSKHIDYSDAETGEYLGWENYENQEDEDPSDWEYRSNYAYDEENDRYFYDFEAPWGSGTKGYRISTDRHIYEKAFDGSSYYQNDLNEEEGLWYCCSFDSAERNRAIGSSVWTEDWADRILEKIFEYDTRDIEGSVYVRTWERGVEVSQEFFTSADDEQPSQWEHYSNVVFEYDESLPFGPIDVHRDFVTSEGEYGIMYFQIDEYDNWSLRYQDRWLDNGTTRIITAWNPEYGWFEETRTENERMVYDRRMTAEWGILSEKTWQYFDGIGPVIIEHEWRDDGNTAYEKVYTNPNDESTYEERTFVDGTGYNWRAFTVRGEPRDFDQSILNLPESIQVIESEAFAGVAGWYVILHEGVTSIASDAFSPNTVLLVPNPAIARLAQEAGYVWFFEN